MECSSNIWYPMAYLLIGALFANSPVHGFGYMNTLSTPWLRNSSMDTISSLWFRNSSLDSYSICSIEAETRQPQCWSLDSGIKPPENVSLSALTGGAFFSCGLLEGSHTPVCWGEKPGSVVPLEFRNVSYSSINCGGWHACAIRRANSSNPEDIGKVDCWGDDYFGQASPPATIPMESITAGAYFTCGLTLGSKTAVCWGLMFVANNGSLLYPPCSLASRLESISAGRSHVCGIARETHEALCWGANDHGQSTPPQNFAFSAITAGIYHTCGLVLDSHEALCWGDNSLGQCNAPVGVAFSIISAGDRYTCGMRMDNMSIQCWGDQVSALMSSFGSSQDQSNQAGKCTDPKTCMLCVRCAQGSYQVSPCGVASDTECADCSYCSCRRDDPCSLFCDCGDRFLRVLIVLICLWIICSLELGFCQPQWGVPK